MRRVIAGIGCRRACPAEEILDLLAEALEKAALPADRLSGLATAPLKRKEPGIAEAAARLGKPLEIVAQADLLAAQSQVRGGSPRVLSATGLASIAEAAALAAAAPDARLLLPRIQGPRATCALAVSTS
ncbi:MAG: cobalamin biosynthesis protein [Rhodospirillales bacterium]